MIDGLTVCNVFASICQGLKNLQESATYKRTSENIQFAKVQCIFLVKVLVTQCTKKILVIGKIHKKIQFLFYFKFLSCIYVYELW